MHAAPNNALYNNQLSQAIQQVDADLSSGDEQLCDWTQALPDDEAADILVEYTPNNELNSLLGYIARCITAQTTTEIQTQQDEQQKQNAWHKMVRHYHAAINDRDY